MSTRPSGPWFKLRKTAKLLVPAALFALVAGVAVRNNLEVRSLRAELEALGTVNTGAGLTRLDALEQDLARLAEVTAGFSEETTATIAAINGRFDDDSLATREALARLMDLNRQETDFMRETVEQAVLVRDRFEQVERRLAALERRRR